MSYIRTIVLILAGLFLMSCDKSASVTVQAVQEQAVKICNFLPSQQSILDIIKATGPAQSTAIVIAEEICKAVVAWSEQQKSSGGVGAAEAPSAMPLSVEGCPKVADVCVGGVFVDDQGNPVDKPIDKPKEGE
jgi:hypothetical protein